MCSLANRRVSKLNIVERVREESVACGDLGEMCESGLAVLSQIFSFAQQAFSLQGCAEGVFLFSAGAERDHEAIQASMLAKGHH